MDRERKDFWVVVLLRTGGIATLAAVLAVMMPTDWMAWAYGRLGLGEFPDLPLVQYLTRSVSALYALHGGLLLLLARDPERYRGVISYMGCAILVFGFIKLLIDLAADLPLPWIWCEGPSIAVLGLLLYLLSRP